MTKVPDILVTETIHHGDYFYHDSVRAASISDALPILLSRSPYYAARYAENPDAMLRQIRSDLIEHGIAYFGWATYKFRVVE